MSDSPARRPASGSCCGGPRGGASVRNSKPASTTAPSGDGWRHFFSRSMIPPGALAKGVVAWGTTGSSHRYAMRKLRTQAIGQVRPRACDPWKTPTRFGSSAVDAVPGVSWRCATAGGRRGLGLSIELSSSVSSASPAFGGRRFSDRIRSKRPVRRRASLRAGAGGRSAQLFYNTIALSSLRPLRARDGVTTGGI